MSNDRQLETNPRLAVQWQLVIYAILLWAVTSLFCSLHLPARAIGESTWFASFVMSTWVSAQAYALLFLILFPTLCLVRFSPNLMRRIGVFALSVVPVIVWLDGVTFQWIRERLVSETTLHILISLLPGLLPFVGLTTLLKLIASAVVVIGVVGVMTGIAKKVSSQWSLQLDHHRSPMAVAVYVGMISGGLSMPALWNGQQTIDEMKGASAFHPFCAFRIVDYHGVGVARPEGDEATEYRLHGLQLFDAAQHRIQQFQSAQLTVSEDAKRYDVVIVILESLQHSMIQADVMPNAYALSQQGLRLNRHFSGGNSSNLGIFSLVNGTESIFFPHASSFTPLLNRLFAQAGYERGFFGGADDWHQFAMDGFINEEHFDQFWVEPVDWLESDQRSIERAVRFLDPQRDRTSPRLALVYLYSSHSPFAVQPEHNVFTPSAPDHYSPPFAKSQHELVWNRYRNSLHQLDQLMAPLLSRDRVVVVVGDHGESLLDDGTIGHGTRLSRAQNMTSAMAYFPGQQPLVIDEPTMHADVLPTILEELGLSVEPEGVFDGTALSATNLQSLRGRIFATMHYMWPEAMLIGPWTQESEQPFGFRIALSLGQWQVGPLNPIDERGLQWPGDDFNSVMSQQVHRWTKTRFGVTAKSSSHMELFRRLLNHPDPKARLEAIKIAEQVFDADQMLLRLLSQRSTDSSPQVRERARRALLAIGSRR